MKKILLLLVLLLAVLLPLSAGAATRIVDSGFGFYIGAGETLLPDYPDLAYLIGEGLTLPADGAYTRDGAAVEAPVARAAYAADVAKPNAK